MRTCDWCGKERETRRIEADQDVCRACLEQQHAKALAAYLKVTQTRVA